MTITEFLLARIAEDEADAQDALVRGFGGWEWLADGGINFEARTHIVRWHPARVLAECQAKRRIVEDAEVLHRDYRETHDPTTEARRLQAIVSVAHLAAVYSNHPDYREEWAA